MPGTFTKSVVEEAALGWLGEIGYTVPHGPAIAAGEPAAERSDPAYRDRHSGKPIATGARAPQSGTAARGAGRRLPQADQSRRALAVERNRAIHRMLVDGTTVEPAAKTARSPVRRRSRSISTIRTTMSGLRSISSPWPKAKTTAGPDVVLFVNGLLLAVIELKNAADENADIWSAFRQLQTYQAQIPALFTANAVLVASDGTQARVGAVGAGREWFKPWRTITGRDDISRLAALQVVLEGEIEKRRFLDLLRHFIVFEDEGGGKLNKKMATHTTEYNHSAADAGCMAASMVGDKYTPWRSNSRWIALTARARGWVPRRKRGRNTGSLAGEPALWDLAQEGVELHRTQRGGRLRLHSHASHVGIAGRATQQAIHRSQSSRMDPSLPDSRSPDRSP